MVTIIRGKGAKVTLKLDPLKKYVETLTSENGKYKNILLDDWVEIYKTFMRGRFRSRGHGQWAPLRPRTKKRVRVRSRMPLLDSYTLVNVWKKESQAPGYYERRTKKGVTLGYGGGARHPFARRLSIKALADVHSKGRGRVPQRKIVVDANDRTKLKMQRALKKRANEAKKSLGMK